MAELKILNVALIGAGAEGIAAAIAADPNAAAADILFIVADKQQLQANYDALKNEFDLLPDLSKSYKELEEGFDALKLEHEALAKINAELQAVITDAPAVAEIEAPKKPELSKKTFTVDKVKYGFAFAAINLDGTVITNEDVLNSPELQKQLVEMGSGFIKSV
jgi:hypothetical protein